MSDDCVLIFRLGSIGDTVVALPCFHAIARAFPGQRRVLLTNALASSRTSSAESILGGTGLVDEVIYYPIGGLGLRSAWALRREVRAVRPATLIYLVDRPRAFPVYRDVAFFKAAGVPRIIGAPRSNALRRCAVDPATGELENEVRRLARVLGTSVSVDLSPSSWDLRLSSTERAQVATHFAGLDAAAPVLAMAPGARILAKDWGRENWTSLLRTLAARDRDMALLLVGGPDERAVCEELKQEWTGPVMNLCGLLTPRETAAALARSAALVCHDSGPMHLAASQGTPCVALFGNYNRPRRWYPFGDGHRVVYEPRGVRAIDVPRVAAEVDRVLAQLGSRA